MSAGAQAMHVFADLLAEDATAEDRDHLVAIRDAIALVECHQLLDELHPKDGRTLGAAIVLDLAIEGGPRLHWGRNHARQELLWIEPVPVLRAQLAVMELLGDFGHQSAT